MDQAGNASTIVDLKQKRKKKPWTVSKRAKAVFQFSRLLHVYSSTLFLALLIFFSATGILLNHTDWLKADAVEGQLEKDIPASLQAELSGFASAEEDNLPEAKGVLKLLRDEYGLRGPKEVNYDFEAKELTFDFQMTSSYVFVTVRPEEKNMTLEYRKFGFWQIMSDLHKGRNSGTSWAWLIDVSAVGMIIFSITGLIILLQNLKQRRLGLILAFGGLVLPVFIYWFLVPRFWGA